MRPLGQYPYVAIDTESTGLYYPRDRAFGFSIATPDGRSAYYDVRARPEALDWLATETEHYKGRIIGHNIKFDYKMLAGCGVRMPMGLLDDTATRACLINEHLLSYTLDDLCWRYLKEKKDKLMYEALAEIFGGLATRNVQMKNIANAKPWVVAPYARKDAELCLRLWEYQQKRIEEDNLHDIVNFERSLIPTLLRTELRGIRINPNRAHEAMDGLTKVLNPMIIRLNEIAGWEVNVNSSPQIKKLLNPWQDTDGQWYVGEAQVPSTKNGGPSISAPVLRELPGEDVKLILNIRSLIKTRDTFLAKHVLEHAVDNVVYPTINQNKNETGGTGTGRLSYSDPAMQQIPSRDKEKAAIVKPVFLPDEDQVWLDTDLASFEVRTFYHLIKEPSILHMYENNPEMDAHGIVAHLTGLPRNASYGGEPNAKQLNLSMIFNQGNGATAEKLGLPWEWDSFRNKSGKIITYKAAGPEAMSVIRQYHARFPGVRTLIDTAKNRALSRGYIFTRFGRRIRFPNGFKAYKASGLLIQSTSADINKKNLILLEDCLNSHNGRLILNTHDSYSISVPRENAEEAFKDAHHTIKNSYPWFRVPLWLEKSGIGNNWAEALGLYNQ